MTLLTTFRACDILCWSGNILLPEMFLSFCIIRGIVISTKELTKSFHKEYKVFIFLWCITFFIFFWIYFQNNAFEFLLLNFMLFESSKFSSCFWSFSYNDTNVMVERLFFSEITVTLGCHSLVKDQSTLRLSSSFVKVLPSAIK